LRHLETARLSRFFAPQETGSGFGDMDSDTALLPPPVRLLRGLLPSPSPSPCGTPLDVLRLLLPRGEHSPSPAGVGETPPDGDAGDGDTAHVWLFHSEFSCDDELFQAPLTPARPEAESPDPGCDRPFESCFLNLSGEVGEEEVEAYGLWATT
jgi:hypothetical protein